MRLWLRPTPRLFTVGQRGTIHIRDLGEIELAPDEMLTFVTETGKRYDFTRKSWGYYATPSVNKRLKQEGFKTALVRNEHGQLYVMVVEADRLAEFEQYCRDEKQTRLTWLDSHAISAPTVEPCASCRGYDWELVFRYDAPPPGETRFSFFNDRPYHREIWRCRTCGHFVNRMDVNLDELYSGPYVEATYGADGLRGHYDRIMALPPERSDNIQRVQRILAFWDQHQPPARSAKPKLLDVGSGLAVFPARMREAGWDCTALDPDPRAVEHARQAAGVNAVCADFLRADHLGQFDLITLNKVLEHVPDPQTMLARCAQFLQPQGVVYVEVPDGEAACREGPGREEFFIEHRCVFSLASLALLAAHAGFHIIHMERLREPSTKYTLFAFLSHAP